MTIPPLGPVAPIPFPHGEPEPVPASWKVTPDTFKLEVATALNAKAIEMLKADWGLEGHSPKIVGLRNAYSAYPNRGGEKVLWYEAVVRVQQNERSAHYFFAVGVGPEKKQVYGMIRGSVPNWNQGYLSKDG